MHVVFNIMHVVFNNIYLDLVVEKQMKTISLRIEMGNTKQMY